MSVQRQFLGWDRPGLHLAADWLELRHAQPGLWDLSQLILVLPGARAGRRLLELLAQRAGQRVLIPPALTTPGQLPELLYQPARPVADPLRALLARIASLRADPPALAPVVPQPPDADDLLAWTALAKDFHRLHESLAAELASPDDVLRHCAAWDDFTEQDRWRAIADLQQRYEDALAAAGIDDLQLARRLALREQRCATPRPILLLAAVDLPQLVRHMLLQLAGPVTALVLAPESESAGFDDLGCLRPEHWTRRHLALDRAALHIVDRPRDQAHQVVRILETLAPAAPGDEPPAPDQITIGLGDETLAPLIQRTLELAGVPARAPAGAPITRARPVTLLAAIARHLLTQRTDDFAALLRHPDLEAHLHRLHLAAGARSWQTLLDRYIRDCLQGSLAAGWLGDPDTRAPLAAVAAALDALAPADRDRPKPLPEWSPAIAALLQAVYGELMLNRADEDDDALARALEAITESLREQADLPQHDTLTPRLTFAQAIQFTLARLADQLSPSPAQPGAVELLGWLELPLDDAPHLIVTGVNEGSIPQGAGADTFLPDRLRKALGLMDHHRRFSRDAFALAAILHSRRSIALIAGRRGSDQEPLAPSRLLLAVPDEQLAARVRLLCDPDAQRPAAPLILLPPAPDNHSALVIPPPAPLLQPIDTLRVTAFRDYLACPYRFYLRHILRLESLDDQAVEMDGMMFGNIAHDIMQAFASSPLRDSDNAGDIAAFLREALDAQVRRRFGRRPSAAVVIQSFQMNERLAALAHWQARQVAEGWRIKHTETDRAARIDVDGQPFTLTGRIDRIDHHPATGRWRILDYKTSDRGDPPDKTHRAGDTWIDLQLPLYLALAAGLNVVGDVQLGYIRLPKRLDDVGLAPAEWSEAELTGAMNLAGEVIRGLRRGVFGPPRYPMAHGTEFAGICQDDAMDRRSAMGPGNAAGWRATP